MPRTWLDWQATDQQMGFLCASAIKVGALSEAAVRSSVRYVGLSVRLFLCPMPL